jgi:hypothetical protein
VGRQSGRGEEGVLGPGTLFSSGLIAGGSLTGILYAILVGTGTIARPQAIGDLVPFLHDPGVAGQLATALLFLGLAWIVARAARKTL